MPVRKRPLRVLFFAGGATREYQFLRTIFYRETLADRMEMSIYLQNGRDDHVDQDVKQDRMLADFPDRIGPGDPKYMSLSEYDVVVAFDPDWSKLSPVQQKNLQEWVNNHAGGIVFVAGPVYSFQLSRPGAYGVEKLLSLYPVVPKDSRLHGSTLPSGSVGHNASRPYALHFSPAAKDYDFLKLDESGESPTAGWNKFFWNDENTTIALGMDTQPKRGFYNYYPVERLKPDSQVIATFAGPAESRLGKSNAFKDHQPFLVTMRAGSGKTLYIGSGELWRLRGFKDGYHDRIWIKMARYVAAGATQQKKYGHILMAQSIPVGVLQFEAQLKGKDLQPLAQENRPTVFVERVVKDGDKPEIQKFDLQPKPGDGDWHGNFVGSIHMKEPGEYRFKLPIPGIANESLEAKLFVRRLDPEKDNLRTNFGYLFQMASETSALKKNLSPEQLRELERYVQVPTDLPQGVSAGKRLFFQAESADAIAKALVTVQPKSETVKGRLEDLWDRGFESINGIVIAVLVTFLLGMIVAFVFFSLEWWIVSALTVLGTLMMTTVVLAAAIFIEPINNLLNVDLYYEVNARNAVVIAPIVVGLVGGGILLILRQWISALVFVGICAFGAIVALVGVQFIGVIYEFFDIDLPVGFSLVMVLIVTLLGIEWLARKLLRLA